MNEWETVERALRRLVIAAGALALTESSIDKYAMEYQGTLADLATLRAQYEGQPTAAEAVSDYCNNVCRKLDIERDCVLCPLMNLRKPIVEAGNE